MNRLKEPGIGGNIEIRHSATPFELGQSGSSNLTET